LNKLISVIFLLYKAYEPYKFAINSMQLESPFPNDHCSSIAFEWSSRKLFDLTVMGWGSGW